MDILAQNDTDPFQIILLFDFYFWFGRGSESGPRSRFYGVNVHSYAATKKATPGSCACAIAPHGSAAANRLQWW